MAFDQNIQMGINSLICTNTNSEGLSVCKIRSHRDGVKALKVAGHSQIVNVEFIRSFDQKAILFDTLGASHSPTLAGPDLVSGSSGKRIDKPLIEETGVTLRSDPSAIH
ncbi:MAG: hypothetical protein K2Q26_13660 [Bdellovibrionales bacterium]|nr:hypothetical protein [Bdellovibrionales bacterium]